MPYPEDTDRRDNPDANDQQCLLLDGTANLDYNDDEQVPRVKGLIELLNEYFGKHRNHGN